MSTSKNKPSVVLALIIGVLIGSILSVAIVTAQSNRAQRTASSSLPATSQRWDYRVIWGDGNAVERSLKVFGDEGYEVAGFTAAGEQGVTVLLRRPKP
ncbi:MAG TPA: hypothetical protein VLM38_09280 [Blastocatellia bacterium]|nr:hypothetical protein [Blastocatellia bacterium]